MSKNKMIHPLSCKNKTMHYKVDMLHRCAPFGWHPTIHNLGGLFVCFKTFPQYQSFGC